MKDPKDETTHFGFDTVSVSEKASKVADVFHSVADRYDLMNDLMSLGTHRVMKQMAANATRAREGHYVLDLAGGTGDLAILLSEYVGPTGQIHICDINGSMLESGRDRLLNRGIVNNIQYVIADGEQPPYPDNSFNSVICAFGIRNFTHKERAFAEMYRVLKPGGKIVILEFSKPENQVVQNAYRGFKNLWPKVGKLVTGDEQSYQYLVESIDMHPDQETLASMMSDNGFTRVRYQNLINGVAAIHEGMKPHASTESGSTESTKP